MSWLWLLLSSAFSAIVSVPNDDIFPLTIISEIQRGSAEIEKQVSEDTDLGESIRFQRSDKFSSLTYYWGIFI